MITIVDDGELQGLNTDERPKANAGDVLWEIDTGKIYKYDKNINPLTGDNWWEV